MNQGFFSSKETQSLSRPDGKKYSCIACGLHKDCKSPKMEPFGNFKKGILNIGIAPREADDRNNKPWQDKYGKIVERAYKELGIDLFEDCMNIHAVQCRATDTDDNDRTPVPYEIECCRKSVLNVIKEYQPKVIIVFGQAGLQSLIGHRWKKDFGAFTKWRGWTIPDQDLDAWVCPIFHPREINKSDVAKTIWKQDLKNALELVDSDFRKYKKPKIETLPEDDLSKLSKIKSHQVAIDYETTGIKPHASGHKIICVAVADSEDHAYTFMLPKSRKARQPFIDLLADPHKYKIAQNMKFEETWSVVRLRQPVVNWEWDTMQASHILDNRQGITGLKFQTYVQFGIIDYSSEVDVWIKSDRKDGGNTFNKIEELVKTEAGRKLLLEYCALDTIYEFRLAMIQMDLMNYNDLPF